MIQDDTLAVRRPGGAIASRPLDFIWLCDTSGSMAGAKIERLNFAIADALGPMREAGRENPQAQIFVRVVQFDDDARWAVAERTPLERFTWNELRVDRGLTAMGDALALAGAAMAAPDFPELYWPPVLVLVTDGFPTDSLPGHTPFAQGLEKLMSTRPGHAALRLAIAIGDDADIPTLVRFIGDPAIPPLQARTAGELHAFIRWTSVATIRRSSAPAAGGASSSGLGPLPEAIDFSEELAWSEPLT